MTRRAFTLLELIITTAIICLLVTITLPALGRAQTAARRTRCASQLKALGLGLNCYAQDSNASLPPGPREMDPYPGFLTDPDRGSPLELFSATRIGRADLSSQNGWYGQGLLWQQRSIAQPRFYFCPEMERRGWTCAQAWPRHMEIAPDAAGEKPVISGTYLYRGGYASAAGTGEGTLSTARNRTGEPLLIDGAFFGLMAHPGGYNVAYLGGAVEFRTFSKSPAVGVQTEPLWDAVRQP